METGDVPNGKNRTALKLLLAAVFSLAIAGVLIFAFAGRSPDYRPPYKLTVSIEKAPFNVLRTPHRTILSFHVPTRLEDTVRQVRTDLQKQGLAWPIEKPRGADVSYRFLASAKTSPAETECILLYADPQNPNATVLSMVSPMQTPSRLDTWRYALSRFIAGEH